MTIQLANNAVSRLAAPITASETTLSVMSGEGARFPALAQSDTFPITVVKANGTLEIMRVTERSSDTFTVVRGQEGTSPADFAVGDRIELRLTSGALDEKIEGDIQKHTGTAATRDVTIGNTDTTAGRLLKVGDLGSNSRGSSVVDFNALPDQYPYSGAIPVMATTGSTNGPPKSDYYYVEQHLYSSGVGNVTQIAIPYRVDSDGMWMRSRFNGTWSAWREIYHSGNLPAPTWSQVTGKPSTFAPSSHTHTWAQVTGKPSTFPPTIGTTSTTAKAGNYAPTWSQVTSKPSTFTPSSHTHTWAQVTGKPSTFAPSSHNHSAANITSGTINGARLPTGHGGVGTYALVARVGGTGTVSWGSTVAGSNLRAAGITSSGSVDGYLIRNAGSSALSGTWRVMSNGLDNNNVALVVRIS